MLVLHTKVVYFAGNINLLTSNLTHLGIIIDMYLLHFGLKKIVLKVEPSRKVLESIELMKSRGTDTVVVVNKQNKYLGIVRINDIQKKGIPGQSIENLITQDTPKLFESDHAKSAMVVLQNHTSDLIIVLNDNEQVTGIITKGSIARSLTTTLWGEDNV